MCSEIRAASWCQNNNPGITECRYEPLKLFWNKHLPEVIKGCSVAQSIRTMNFMDFKYTVQYLLTLPEGMSPDVMISAEVSTVFLRLHTHEMWLFCELRLRGQTHEQATRTGFSLSLFGFLSKPQELVHKKQRFLPAGEYRPLYFPCGLIYDLWSVSHPESCMKHLQAFFLCFFLHPSLPQNLLHLAQVWKVFCKTLFQFFKLFVEIHVLRFDFF